MYVQSYKAFMCAGIEAALKLIPTNHKFRLVWESDLCNGKATMQIAEEFDSKIKFFQESLKAWRATHDAKVVMLYVVHDTKGDRTGQIWEDWELKLLPNILECCSKNERSLWACWMKLLTMGMATTQTADMLDAVGPFTLYLLGTPSYPALVSGKKGLPDDWKDCSYQLAAIGGYSVWDIFCARKQIGLATMEDARKLDDLSTKVVALQRKGYGYEEALVAATKVGNMFGPFVKRFLNHSVEPVMVEGQDQTLKGQVDIYNYLSLAVRRGSIWNAFDQRCISGEATLEEAKQLDTMYEQTKCNVGSAKDKIEAYCKCVSSTSKVDKCDALDGAVLMTTPFINRFRNQPGTAVMTGGIDIRISGEVSVYSYLDVVLRRGSVWNAFDRRCDSGEATEEEAKQLDDMYNVFKMYPFMPLEDKVKEYLKLLRQRKPYMGISFARVADKDCGGNDLLPGIVKLLKGAVAVERGGRQIVVKKTKTGWTDGTEKWDKYGMGKTILDSVDGVGFEVEAMTYGGQKIKVRETKKGFESPGYKWNKKGLPVGHPDYALKEVNGKKLGVDLGIKIGDHTTDGLAVFFKGKPVNFSHD